MRPLDDITVLALEHAIAGPFCTRQLADLGARVIKIERPGVGDFSRSYDAKAHGLSSHFVWVNRSKESVTLNLKHPDAQAILMKLLTKADVLVQNLLPGAAKRLGLSYESLHDNHPKLIVCDISGYGDDGPFRDKKAYDLLIQSESGFVSITGSSDVPAKAGCSIADISAGMYAFSNILAALFQRSKTGLGKRIEISLLESMTEWMGHPLYYALEGEASARTGAAHATIYPYGPFPAGDGDLIVLGVQSEREWKLFCEKVLEQPHLVNDDRFATNSRRSMSRVALYNLVVDAFSTLTSEQVVQRLDDAQIAHSRLNDMRKVWQHEQLEARRRWVEIKTPVGPLPALLPPGTPSLCEARMDPVPALGEHTDRILKELGYDSETITRLHADQAV